MRAGLHISYFLTLYVHTLTTDSVPSYRVNAINYIFTYPGWHSGVYEIVVRWMEGAEQILTVIDILATGTDGQIVTEENADCKIRQAHQLLSCEYANSLKLCYDYNIGAVHRCKKIDDPPESLKCVCMVLDMINKIDEMVVRMRGTLWCIYQLSPKSTFDKDVSEAIEDFKSYYDNLNFDRETLDKENHDAIINSIVDNMAIALRRLGEFYNSFCRPINNEDEDGISRHPYAVQVFDEKHQPLRVIELIKYRLDSIVNVSVEEYDELFGFKYDSKLKTTSIKYNPKNKLEN